MSPPLGHGVPWDPLSSLNPVSPLGGLVSSVSPGATVPWIQRLPPGGPVPPLVLLSPWCLVPPVDPMPSAVLLCPYPLSLGAASLLDLFWCPPFGLSVPPLGSMSLSHSAPYQDLCLLLGLVPFGPHNLRAQCLPWSRHPLVVSPASRGDPYPGPHRDTRRRSLSPDPAPFVHATPPVTRATSPAPFLNHAPCAKPLPSTWGRWRFPVPGRTEVSGGVVVSRGPGGSWGTGSSRGGSVPLRSPSAMANHLRFIGRTVMVQNGNVDAAYGALSR